MFATLSDKKKAGAYSVLVMAIALAVALAIRSVGMASGLSSSALRVSIPADAALIMMLVATSRLPTSLSAGSTPKTPRACDIGLLL